VTDRMERGWARSCLIVLSVLALMALAAGGAFVGAGWYMKRLVVGPDPVTVANSSLQGLREQSRLATFAARYVAVVTSTQSKLGLTAQKTLIMPGLVRYEVDLAKLSQRDVAWDGAAKKLMVRLPGVEVVGPEVDYNHIREYSGGGVLMALTDAESKLDESNRKAAQAELVRQAMEPTPMKLARDATRRAVERSFAMPLRAVGVDATVEVSFADEANANEHWDVSRSLAEIYANKR